jgi:NADH-quinone oxidoreductase subunit C
METAVQLVERLKAALPEWEGTGANGADGVVRELKVSTGCLRSVARWLRDDPELRLDYCSNVTGVDWPVRKVKVKVRRLVEGEEKEVEEVREEGGYLEVVYHLFSMARRLGPVVLRSRTVDRTRNVRVPSLTPVWRSAELQEREVYDLFGVVFDGHPDLRRLLMWEGFVDHPMRKDYVEPDDYEYEPTAHDRVAERAAQRREVHGEGRA